MVDWRDTARELIASGMSVNNVCRQIGKSEHAVRFNLNINGFAERYRAIQSRRGRKAWTTPRPAQRERVEEPQLLKTITLPTLSLGPAPDDDLPVVRKISPRVRIRDETPGVARIRKIHQRMVRQGKFPGRDLISEWRA